MAYRGYGSNQGASPWAAGAPPGHGAPSMPYGHPQPGPMNPYGPAQRGPPAPYGSGPAAWGGPPAGGPMGAWGAPPMGTRGRPVPPVPPMKRPWMEHNNGPANKKFARGGHQKPGFGRGGGAAGYKGNKNFVRKAPQNQKKNETSVSIYVFCPFFQRPLCVILIRIKYCKSPAQNMYISVNI